MADFPTLKTGAVVQYPATRRFRFQNQILRFLDGTDQRYRDSAGPLHEWEIHLAALDESEISAIEQFLEVNRGSFGSFTFTDPWDGTVYSSCSLAADELASLSLGEMQGKTSLTVIENPN